MRNGDRVLVDRHFQFVLHKADDLENEPYADINYPPVETPDEWVLHGFSYPDYPREFGEQGRSESYEKSSLDLAMCDVIRKKTFSNGAVNSNVD